MYGSLTKRQLLYFVVIDVLLIAAACWYFFNRQSRLPDDLADFPLGTVTLSSPVFAEGGPIPVQYTCQADGLPVSPPLKIDNVPAGAKTMVLVMEDPDAPLRTFTHWVLWNVPAQDMSIAEGITPPGAVVGKNDSGTKAYVPACPPNGLHRYFFKLYVLDAAPQLSSDTDLRTLLNHIAPNVV